jgi:hypothetical protein
MKRAFLFQDKIFRTVKNDITYVYETESIMLYVIKHEINPDENSGEQTLDCITYGATGI